jgi:catechol 2,3-dioxygenase-like lactoylglutathione lyase family enzyme
MIAMLDHVGIQCADMAASASFYDTVLAPLGGRRIMDFGVAIGYGTPDRPDFWMHEPRVWPEYHENYYGANASTRTGTTSRLSATCRGKELASGVRGVRSG